MLDEKFIKREKEFIAQFDGLVPKDGSQVHVKRLAEQYNENLEHLEASREQVIKLFSLSDFNEKKMKRNEKYPAAIAAYHTAYATVLGTAVLSTLFLGTSFMLGGANMAAWSTPLKFIAGGVGLVPAVPLAVGSFALHKKHFDRSTVDKKKLNFIEKRIMKRVKEKEYAFALLASQVESNMPLILSGEYNISEKKTVQRKRFFFFGKPVDREVTVFKDGYSALPRRTRKKLDRVITGVNKEYKDLLTSKVELQKRVEQIILQKREREELLRQEEARLEEERRRAEIARAREERGLSSTTKEPAKTATQEQPPTQTQTKPVVVIKRVKKPSPGSRVAVTRSNSNSTPSAPRPRPKSK